MPKVGRPSKYTKELLKKAQEYLTVWEQQGDKIPSHIALSKYIGISTTYLYDWAKEEDKKEFSDILREVKELQQQVLLNNGLDGTFNAAITKLVLGKHGFHEKQDQNVTIDAAGEFLKAIKPTIGPPNERDS